MYLRAAAEKNTSVIESLSIYFERQFTYIILHERATIVMQKSRFLTGSQTAK